LFVVHLNKSVLYNTMPVHPNGSRANQMPPHQPKPLRGLLSNAISRSLIRWDLVFGLRRKVNGFKIDLRMGLRAYEEPGSRERPSTAQWSRKISGFVAIPGLQIGILTINSRKYSTPNYYSSADRHSKGTSSSPNAETQTALQSTAQQRCLRIAMQRFPD
jgi:hypothetical protein